MTTEEKKTEDGDVLGTGEVRADDEAAEKVVQATADAVMVDVATKPAYRSQEQEEVTPQGVDLRGGASMKMDFTERVRSRTAGIRKLQAFREFFDAASELNEVAHNLGIRGAVLDADKGDVTVTFKSREEAQSA